MILRMAGIVATAALAVTLSACSGAAAPTAPAGAPVAADDQAAVRVAYDSFTKSLVSRDFATSCAMLTDDAAQKIPAAVAAKGGSKDLSCAQAFAEIYQQPGAADKLDQASRTTTVKNVTVDGDVADVVYTATIDGTTTPDLTGKVLRVGGRWRVSGTS